MHVYIPLPYKDFQCSRSQRLHQTINALVKKNKGIKVLISFQFFQRSASLLFWKSAIRHGHSLKRIDRNTITIIIFFFYNNCFKKTVQSSVVFCNLISLTFLLYLKSIEDGQRQYIYSNYKYECYIFRMANIFLLHSLFLIICVELRKGKS